jgi:RecB family exonuclease
VITPRTTRLLRVPDLRAMHRAVDACTSSGDPLESRRIAVIVPTRGAGESLRRTLEHLRFDESDRRVFVAPEVLTRADLYTGLHEHLPGAPPMLSEFEREVLFKRSARIASDSGAEAPFSLRPGLIVEILAFYDELRRRHKTVSGFDRLMTDSLGGSVDIDRGAERMMRQTRFLTAAFEEFERSVAASGSLDEHALRRLLLESAPPAAFSRIVITVADQAADPLGLWTADFDLLARLPGVEAIDVIATENLLAAGFHQRVHDLLPGVEEAPRMAESPTPVLIVPKDSEAQSWLTCRDREEELAALVRSAKTGESKGRVAAIFQRPLPYLYLARNVFAEAYASYDAFDALPLAAEPFAAALDLVFTAAASEATRSSMLELLRSPHWRFESGSGGPLDARTTAALDAFLLKVKYLGGWSRLEALESSRPPARVEAALSIAAAIARRLKAFHEAPAASAQIRLVLAFIADHERVPDVTDAQYTPHMRARGAVLGALTALAAAHERHDDGPLTVPELAGTIRRWIEGQTFSPRTGPGAMTLLDAHAATYADLDEARLVGLVETDWPDRCRHSIFYPSSLLSQLGWPVDNDRLTAGRARFHDLLRLPRERVSLSTFTLENDAIVSPSAFLEDIDSAGLAVERRESGVLPRVFVHEALAETPLLPDAVDGVASEWLALRTARSAVDPGRFRGSIGAHATESHAVSHLERYLECPFKYFARHVLRLEEERDDESVLTPQERGQLLHEVFEKFFAVWHAGNRGAVTAANLPDALARFEQIAEARLAQLSEVDRALERTYLLGSAAAPGLAERAFAIEIEHGAGVVERLLEYPLEGEFEFKGPDGARRLRIRAKADRIDLLDDGTLRIIDYKASRAPRTNRALQLPVYGVCAAQHLTARDGRTWTVSRAGYVAFKEKNAFSALGGSGSLATALEDGQQRLLETVATIERGEFPVDPDEPFLCTRCGYAGVCRKDYVGDE